MNNFGNYLKKLRGARSLRDMERITGLSHTYLSTLEKGMDPRSKKERRPTPEVLKKLADTLSIDYFSLMEKAGYINKEDTFFEEIPGNGVKIYKGAEAAQRRQEIGTDLTKFIVENKAAKDLRSRFQDKDLKNDLLFFLNKNNISYFGYSLSKDDRMTILKEIGKLFPQYVDEQFIESYIKESKNTD
ncbi:helix-turn-helix transcriptional regulator [Peribacillus frigoritolerans]|uniref:helix-turn-helix domain-containing protein n=1 Tax=Peribacillus frigoritolerans TaxID=450367 RepID=UPI00345D2516